MKRKEVIKMDRRYASCSGSLAMNVMMVAGRRKMVWIAAIFSLAFLHWGQMAWGGDTPTVVVKGTIDKVIELVTDDRLKAPDQTLHRRQLLEETIGERFDFEEMSRRSLAAHWRNRSEEERREFVELFQALLSNTYAERIENYAGETVNYLGERIRNGFAEVQTTIVSTKGQLSLAYRMMVKEGGWRVYDVVADGVSLVRNYRGQFDRIIRNHSYEELVKRLRERSDTIESP
jgi:phospholipid transport system substrate-binding protein